MAKVQIMETVLRDAGQSLIATRMPIEEMLPIVDTMDQVGYAAVECWGGETSCFKESFQEDTYPDAAAWTEYPRIFPLRG